jgi:acetylornithine aminotransferase/acetylornithine/N-succinyldiaminopimelate aminotransferase
MHGTTFGGGPLACAVALELLNVIRKEKLLRNVRQVGGYMTGRLKNLAKKHPCIGEVRGQGLMIGMELNSADLAKAAVGNMLKEGIILNRTDETVVRFLPPFIIGRKHVDIVIDRLDKVLAKLTQPARDAAEREK